MNMSDDELRNGFAFRMVMIIVCLVLMIVAIVIALCAKGSAAFIMPFMFTPLLLVVLVSGAWIIEYRSFIKRAYQR